MFSRLKRQLSVFVPLAAGLLIITLLTTWGGLLHYKSELDHQLSDKPLTVATTAHSQKDSGQTAANPLAPGSSDKSVAGAQDQAAGAGTYYEFPAYQNPIASYAGSSAIAPAAQSSIISLYLSVNGHPKGSVKLAAGSNQCDVLSQAMSEGLIGSLDMRYNPQLKSYAVYVIDGIGDPSSVWWVYTVNGKAPPRGCSYITAHSGDSVNWQYEKT